VIARRRATIEVVRRCRSDADRLAPQSEAIFHGSRSSELIDISCEVAARCPCRNKLLALPVVAVATAWALIAAAASN